MKNKTIILLFGEMGCGKNYWGKFFSKQEGAAFFDGDSVLTPQINNAISRFGFISKDMLEEYIFILTNSIINIMQNNTDLVLYVAQALYREEDRILLFKALQNSGYTVSFIWVKVPLWQNIKQLYSRSAGIKWVLYFLASKPFFQKPDLDNVWRSITIYNEKFELMHLR